VIPVGDSPVARRFPIVNYSLIVANIGVFIFMLALSTAGPQTAVEARRLEQQADACYGFISRPNELERFYCRRGFQPREFFDTVQGETDPRFEVNRTNVLLSIFTSMFVHAGWLHILGNMLFLWVFGDNVEDRLGHIGYALFYLAAGAVAALTQAFIDVNTVVPMVGASGAVAGVLGAYLVYYPKATVNVVIPFFILIFIPIPVPAILMIGLWFLQNLFAGLASLGPETAAGSGVAFFAHVGGFLFGALVVLLFFRHRRQHHYAR
jgi:membrane associated rhomboid family serine protease